MKTLKVLAIAIFTFGAVSAAKAQVGISINANFGRPVNYLPVYTEPVYVERPVVYHRPAVVYVNRPVVYRRSPVYYNRTVVVNRPVHFRNGYRNDRHYVRYDKHNNGHGNGHGHGRGRH
ncbi:MAG: hypothetical protein EOP47_25215 [Sphingobacteriaceae bacterium]|nr:MAG: hypothetical protein EOP47_25215 [Sphingobacteriaceae bacterium]